MATIAITGAARSIAFELVKDYAKDGARVFAFCRDLKSAGALQAVAARGRLLVHHM